MIWLLACSGETVVEAPQPVEPTIVLVVLDTVRADHMGACGYDRPTTPVFDALVADGASLNCTAISSGDWTLPSHASFFTGAPQSVHGAHSLPEGNQLLGMMRIRPLGPSLPTLAETFVGYQSIALSGNPVVSEETGLYRGFEWSRTAGVMGALWGHELLAALDEGLAQADDRPLFLFVNIADAHQPWEPIPEGIDWLPPRHRYAPKMPDVYNDKFDDEELKEHFAHVTDVYDWGIRRADKTMGGILERLEAAGRADNMRLVVVSDHGEFLGEHGLVDHGRYLWEPNQRVAVLTSDNHTLPDDLPTAHVFDLVQGKLPATLKQAESVAYPDMLWSSLSRGRYGVHTSVARWDGPIKTVWMEGTCSRYDLAADPDELAPIEDDCSSMTELVERAKASAEAPVEMDPALLERLKAAGYME